MRKYSIVFFGTGALAVKSLEFLSKFFLIELVVTKPKPAGHRGEWPVEELARRNNIDVLLASSSSDLNNKFKTKRLFSQVGVVIDFGLIISAKIINKFPMGIINSHFSLLPRWRGADPINFAILHGDSTTGVSLMKIVPKLDEGPLIAQAEYKIPKEIDSAGLTTSLVSLSNNLLIKILPPYIENQIIPSPQSHRGISYSHKLKKSDGVIDWIKPAEQIEREIRAYFIWPKSRTFLGKSEIIVKKATINKENGPAGQFKIVNNKILVHCGKKSLELIEIQPVGKKPMSASDFLRGYTDKLGLG